MLPKADRIHVMKLFKHRGAIDSKYYREEKRKSAQTIVPRTGLRFSNSQGRHKRQIRAQEEKRNVQTTEGTD